MGVLLTLQFSMGAQRNCSTMDVLEEEIIQDPERPDKLNIQENHYQQMLRNPHLVWGERNVITIPVVVHVLYRTAEENISDAQILSQINVLNADFSATNSDRLFVPASFRSAAGNPSIQFVLAKQTPQRVSTNGITRKFTSRTSWGKTNDIKSASLGGVDPWNSSNYLNIWICNIGNGLLGYAQFPGGNPYTDGIVIDFKAFGVTGSVRAPYDKGRTATHEVAHWLNLRHIWGDQYCGSDLVSDTPVHNAANYGCPTSPHMSACSPLQEEMTMNFMDYTDDQCMYMFTAGQGLRMRSVLVAGGARHSVSMSPGAKEPISEICAVPSNVVVSEISTSGAKLSWSPVASAMYYIIEYKLPLSSVWTRVTATSNTLVLTNLKEANSYQYRLMTSCNASAGQFTSVATFNTISTSGCTDIFEPNDNRTTARSIIPGIKNVASISSATDEDWFKFTNSSLQKNVKVTVADLPEDYKIELYRGTVLIGTSSNDGLSAETIVYNNNLSATVFYVRVISADGGFTKDKCYSVLAERSSASYFTEQGTAFYKSSDIPDVKIFPNPAGDMVQILIHDQKLSGFGLVAVYDVFGNVHDERAVNMSSDGVSLEISLSDYKEGLYFVHYANASEKYTYKLFVVK